MQMNRVHVVCLTTSILKTLFFRTRFILQPGLDYHQRWSRGHKPRGQGQGHEKNPRPRPRTAFPRTTLSRLRPRTKDTNASALEKKSLHKNFSGDLKKKKKRLHKNFSSDTQNFNNSKNSAVLEPRTRGLDAKAKGLPKPRTSKRVLEDSTSDYHNGLPSVRNLPHYGDVGLRLDQFMTPHYT